MRSPGLAAAAAIVAANRVPAIPARGSPARGFLQRSGNPGSHLRLGAPEGLEAVDLRLEEAEGLVPGLDRPRDRRAEGREHLEGGLDGRPVSFRIRIEECRLRREPVGRPQRQPSPDPERARRRVRVHDGPRDPGLAAQDDRPLRP